MLFSNRIWTRFKLNVKNTELFLSLMKFKRELDVQAKPFAFQHFNIQPDIITSAKGLGNGLPIGAMIGKGKVVGIL